MNETPVNPEPNQKTVKFEIGKLLAIVITVVVIAGLASAYLSSGLYKGFLQGDEKIGALTAEQEAALAEDCYFFTEDELNQVLESKYITEKETVLVNNCLEQQQSEVKIDGALTAEQEAALAEDCGALTQEEINFYLQDPNLNDQERALLNDCLEKYEAESVVEGALTKEQEAALEKDCNFFTEEEFNYYLNHADLNQDEELLLNYCLEEINKVYLETDTSLTDESVTSTESTYEMDTSLDNSTESTTTETYEETSLSTTEDNTATTTDSTIEKQDTTIEDGTTETLK